MKCNYISTIEPNKTREFLACQVSNVKNNNCSIIYFCDDDNIIVKDFNINHKNISLGELGHEQQLENSIYH